MRCRPIVANSSRFVNIQKHHILCYFIFSTTIWCYPKNFFICIFSDFQGARKRRFPQEHGLLRRFRRLYIPPKEGFRIHGSAEFFLPLYKKIILTDKSDFQQEFLRERLLILPDLRRNGQNILQYNLPEDPGSGHLLPYPAYSEE